VISSSQEGKKNKEKDFNSDRKSSYFYFIFLFIIVQSFRHPFLFLLFKKENVLSSLCLHYLPLI